MNDVMAPELLAGAMAMTLAILYAAWYEQQKKNYRDARLLATVAAMSLAGSAAFWWS
jgi:hypothetical protein